MKRYQEGGEAEGLSGTAGKEGVNKKPRSMDDMSFGQAFRAARKGGKSTFMWRGDKYMTETKEEKDRARADKDLKEVEVTGKRRMTADDFMKGSDRKMGVETGMTRVRPSMVDFMSEGRRKPSKDSVSDKSKPTRRSSSSPFSSVLERYRNTDIPRRGFNKGGSIDGCAKRGKTRGKII